MTVPPLQLCFLSRTSATTAINLIDNGFHSLTPSVTIFPTLWVHSHLTLNILYNRVITSFNLLDFSWHKEHINLLLSYTGNSRSASSQTITTSAFSKMLFQMMPALLLVSSLRHFVLQDYILFLLLWSNHQVVLIYQIFFGSLMSHDLSDQQLPSACY